MKKVSLWIARLFAFALLLAGSSGQTVSAQKEITDGYYYIGSSTINDIKNCTLYEYFRDNDDVPREDWAWRCRLEEYEPNKVPTKEDYPYIFKLTKQANGSFYMQNINRGLYFNQNPIYTGGAGGGLGQMEEPRGYYITWNTDGGAYSIQDSECKAWMVDWRDHYASYCWENDYAGVWGGRFWTFQKIDDALMGDNKEPEVIEGNLADGYYLINLPQVGEGNIYLTPSSTDNENYILDADIIDSDDYDDAFIFHVKKLANGNYSIKNCGKQASTYIYPYVFDSKTADVILMNGNKAIEHKIELLNTGNAYLYMADREDRFGFVASTQKVVTTKATGSNATVKFIPVADGRITSAMALREAITDAKGGMYVAGENPGNVSKAALDEFEAVIKAAEAEAADADHAATIAKVEAAAAAIEAAKVPFADGYYRIVSPAVGTFMSAAKVDTDGKNTWWFTHNDVDELDPVGIWYISTNEKGERVMKNTGSQELTYLEANVPGEEWGHVLMTGNNATTQKFVYVSGNTYQIFGSDNKNPFVAGNNNLVTTNRTYYPSSFWQVEKVLEEDVDFMATLNMAITDAAGAVASSNVGPNPGQNTGDATAINAAIEKAREMYEDGSADEAEIEAMVAELKAATAEFLSQERTMVPVTEGYYNIVNVGYKSHWENGYKETAFVTSSDGQLKWGELNVSDPGYLFKFTDNGDGTFTLQNMKYQTYVGTYSKSANCIQMTADAGSKHSFKYLGDEQWNVTNDIDKLAYLLNTFGDEPAGVIRIENGGAGTRAAWYLRKVTDEAVIEELLEAGKQAGLLQNLKNAVAKGVTASNATIKYDTDYDNPLIREVDDENPLNGQMWGTQEPSAAGSGGYSSYANLIDGVPYTCFQSTWQSSVASAPQWFQFDLRNRPVKEFTLMFGLRDGEWGVKEQWSEVAVYGTNDPERAEIFKFDENNWEFIGRYNDLPVNNDYSTNNRTWYYTIKDAQKEYRYLRFLVESTYEPQDNMMYTIGDLQLYKTSIDEENSSYSYIPGMKEAKENLDKVIEEANAIIEGGVATQEDIDKVVAATKAVLDLYPDLGPLEKLTTEVDNYIGKFAYYTKDDQEDQKLYGDVSEEQYNAILEALGYAMDYDELRPTREDIDARYDALKKAFALYKSQQRTFETNKWYYIVNTDKTRTGETGNIWQTKVEGDVMLAPKSTKTYVAGHWDRNKDGVTWGHFNHDTNERDPESYSDPYSMWRLIDVTPEGSDEKVYNIQNRATGWNIESMPAGEWNERPAMLEEMQAYQVKLVKSGQYILQSPKGKVPLHASGDGVVNAWPGEEDTPSSWTFEAVPDDIENLEVALADNSIQIMSLPFAMDEAASAVNATRGIVTYAVKGISADNTQLYLKKKTTFEAGEPFIAVAHDFTKFDAESEAKVKFAMPLANEFSLESKTANGLVASIDLTLADAAGYAYIDKSAVKITEEGSEIQGHTGYVNAGLITNEEGEPDLVITLGEGVINAIMNAVSNMDGAKVNVYTIDGVIVKKNVERANATNGLTKGIYIVGKNKVMVK